VGSAPTTSFVEVPAVTVDIWKAFFYLVIADPRDRNIRSVFETLVNINENNYFEILMISVVVKSTHLNY
jgi:hypothetical protein